MNEKEVIRDLFYQQRLNISEIQIETGKDRKTITKYIDQDDWNTVIRKNTEKKDLKINSYKEEIDLWLEEDRKVRRKQRHTAKRIYSRLLEKYGEKLECSYRTIANYVCNYKEKNYKADKCMLPLQHPPGEAQVDFGEADFYEDGDLLTGKYLVISFPYSNAGYIQLFKSENSECLLEGMKSFFHYIKRVPTKIWFDNASTMVVNIYSKGERTVTESFSRFKNHYNFEAVFCNPSSGHEKGSVESKVGYLRRNLLVPVPEILNLKDYNKSLFIRCDKDIERTHYSKELLIKDLFQEEIKTMLYLPNIEFDVCRYEKVRVNANGKFTLNLGRHSYSTSPKYAHKIVIVKITAYDVVALDEEYEPIVTHSRIYGEAKEEKMEWLPYLTHISRKPRALKYTGIYSMLPKTMQDFFDKEKTKTSDVLKLLADITEKSDFNFAVKVIENAINSNVFDAESIQALYNRLKNVPTVLPELKLSDNIPNTKVLTPDMSIYDQFLKEEHS